MCGGGRRWLEGETGLIHHAESRGIAGVPLCGVVATPFRRFAPDASQGGSERAADKSQGWRTKEKGRANRARSRLSMHRIMEMRPPAALENYVDVMRHPSTPPLGHPRAPPPLRDAPAAVFGLSRIHKIQLSSSSALRGSSRADPSRLLSSWRSAKGDVSPYSRTSYWCSS
ncbi:hypothetical protein KM043_005546 [Ampulex compressa]|nr:hypothetical protein KM043_005546 [Ampulex compressa]